MAVIHSKTPAGQAALQSRSVALTPRQRSAFIMFDGKRSSDQILQMTIGLGVTQADLDVLVEKGLLESTGVAAEPAGVASAAAAAPAAVVAPRPPSSHAADAATVPPSQDAQASYLKAYPVATRLTSGLGLRGFRLNLAVEAAGDLKKLRELAPRIKEAVGPEKFRELEDALR